MEITPWTLQGPRARLDGQHLSLTIHLLRPCDGFGDIRYLGCSLKDVSPLRIFLPPLSETADQEQLAEAYVRGDDLVAAYIETALRPVRPQAYWRAILPSGPAAGVQLILSMQTSLLDSDPGTLTETALPVDEVWHCTNAERGEFRHVRVEPHRPCPLRPDMGTSLCLFRLPGDQFSYAEMLHPSDYVGACLERQPTDQPRLSLRYELFSEHLEKGVIRRVRAQSVFLPRRDDQDLALELLRQLSTAPPPLTA